MRDNTVTVRYAEDQNFVVVGGWKRLVSGDFNSLRAGVYQLELFLSAQIVTMATPRVYIQRRCSSHGSQSTGLFDKPSFSSAEGFHQATEEALIIDSKLKILLLRYQTWVWLTNQVKK